MGAALVTAIGAVVVAVLVFVANRLESQDELKNISRQIDLIDRLNPGSVSHTHMTNELVDSVEAYRIRQASRRATQSVRRWTYGLYLLGVVLVFGSYVVRHFDLGKYEGLVSYALTAAAVAGVSALIGVLSVNLVLLIRRKRAKKSEVAATEPVDKQLEPESEAREQNAGD